MTFQDLTSGITAAVAVYGLGAWRAQTAGKRKLELAEEALVLFYEAADAIRHIRAPFSFESEQRDLARLPHEPDERFDARKKVSVQYTRLQQYSELFSKLRAMRYKFKALFGSESGTSFEMLDSILNDIALSARMLAHLWGLRDFEIKDENRYDADREKYESIFWQVDQDEIADRVDTMLSEVELICRPVLAPPPVATRIELWLTKFRRWLRFAQRNLRRRGTGGRT